MVYQLVLIEELSSPKIMQLANFNWPRQEAVGARGFPKGDGF
jgi:hypothetical protein